MKSAERQEAIRLRKEGKTYDEILAQIPVAKSTLSGWLKAVHLAKPQKQRISKRRKEAALRGAHARHQTRLSEIEVLRKESLAEVGSVTSRELWFIAAALYWAEGSKQHEHSPSTGIMFGNSDARMIKIFLLWLAHADVSMLQVHFELYIHETRKSETSDFKHWWTQELNLPKSKLEKVYFKKGNPKTNRKNISGSYHGLLRVKVRSSTSLNRKIDSMICAIVTSLGSGVIGNTSAFGAEDSRIVP